jgi:hypothetical protein
VKRTLVAGIMALVLTGCGTTTSPPVAKPAPPVTTTVSTPSPTVTQTPTPTVPTYVHPGHGLISEADFYKWVKLNTTYTPAQGKRIAYDACMLFDDQAPPGTVLSVIMADHGSSKQQVFEESIAITAGLKAYCPEHTPAWNALK